MATDAEAAGEGTEEAPDETQAASPAEPSDQAGADPGASGEEEDVPHFVEVWNDYDPSHALRGDLPGRREAGRGGELGRLLHHRAGQAHRRPFRQRRGGRVRRRGRGRGVHDRARPSGFRPASSSSSRPGSDHDIYAQGATALRLLSFFPTTEIISTFQQVIYPVGDDRAQLEATAADGARARPEQPAGELPVHARGARDGGRRDQEPPELTETQRLLGMTEPGVLPREVKTTIYTPGEDKVEEFVTYRDDAPEEPDPGSSLPRRRRGAGEAPAPRRPGRESPARVGSGSRHAGVAELADAPGLGPGGLRPLEVRLLSPASRRRRPLRAGTRRTRAGGLRSFAAGVVAGRAEVDQGDELLVVARGRPRRGRPASRRAPACASRRRARARCAASRTM